MEKVFQGVVMSSPDLTTNDAAVAHPRPRWRRLSQRFFSPKATSPSELDVTTEKIEEEQPGPLDTHADQVPSTSNSEAGLSYPEIDQLLRALTAMVDNSATHLAKDETQLYSQSLLYPPDSYGSDAITVANFGSAPEWLSRFFDPRLLEKLFAAEKMGNYVMDRKTGEKTFESMPIFTRIGMHLLFVRTDNRILQWSAIMALFKELSIRQGRIYDNEDPQLVSESINSFIKTYKISLEELLEPNLKAYKTFNSFFARHLNLATRPIAEPDDPSILTSSADCRLTVYQNVSEAKKFWIKGRDFSIASLLDDPNLAKAFGSKPSLAIFRLAPQDYHRYHAFTNARLGKLISIPGTYYTVNPQAINGSLDVFTANRRDIFLMSTTVGSSSTPIPFAFVAIGALLVGSVNWSKRPGDDIKKGEDLGWFQYGGSTCVLICPQGLVTFDEDLVKTSKAGLETYVRVGERIGKIGK